MESAAALANVCFRMASVYLQAFASLPDETLSGVGREIENKLGMNDLGEAINQVLTLLNRLDELTPELYKNLAGRLINGVDGEAAGKALAAASKGIAEAAKEDTDISEALKPEALGGRLNRAVVGFNRYMEKSENTVGGYLAKVLKEIDAKELEKAMRNLAGGLTEALLSNTRRALAVLRPAMSAGWRIFRFYVGSSVRRIFGRGEPKVDSWR